MKTTASELKKRAKLTLSGNYGIAVGTMLITGTILVITALVLVGTTIMIPFTAWSLEGRRDADYLFGSSLTTLAAVFVVVMIASLLIYLLICGIRRMFLNMSVNQPFSMGDMLYAFTHKPYRFLGIYLISFGVGLVLEIPYCVVSFTARLTGYIPVMVVLQILMYLLILAGMIVYNLNFGMAAYLLVENPERTVIGCLRESAAMMKGNKGRMFYLGLSFIGMYLLGAGSLGIGYLWIYPYMETTWIHFYLDISTVPMQEEACSTQEMRA